MSLVNLIVAVYVGSLVRVADNVLQISEGTNSVGIVRLDFGFCLCAVMRGAFNKLKLKLEL
jgi:hypothetical protein